MSATSDVQGVFLERAVRKQKQAVKASETLPELAPPQDEETQESPMVRAKFNLRYWLGIGTAHKH